MECVGDPLSQFLFAICLEGLTRKLNSLGRELGFKHHPKCALLNITHLAYADDMLLFSRREMDCVRKMMKCQDEFGRTAGLRANLVKSNIYIAGVDALVRKEIL